MHVSIRSICVFTLGATALFAQNADEGHWPVTLGFKVGVPVTEMFNTGGNSAIGPSTTFYSSSVPRYEFGPSAEFRLPFHLRFEVDGLYKRGGFDGSIQSFISPGYTPTGNVRTSFNQWEIPGVFKYNVSLGHWRPFVDFGASYRHISTITQRTYIGDAAPVYSDNSSALVNRNSFGGVAGFGMTFKKGPFEITPEARYTRWANSAFEASSLRSNKDQGDVLLGISF
jgi:Outer membrane protein beta-barrel domain